MRFYLSQTTGDGTENNVFRPAVAQHTNTWKAVDFRPDVTVSGWMLVEVPNSINHAAIIADPLVIDTGIEDVLGNEISLDSPISDINNYAQILNFLDSRDVPTDDLLPTDTVRELIRRCIKRILVTQILKGDDVTVNDNVNPARRGAINARLNRLGIPSVTGNRGRGIIKEIVGIEHKFLKTHHDN